MKPWADFLDNINSRNLGSGKVNNHDTSYSGGKGSVGKEIALCFFLKFRRSLRLRYLSCQGNMKFQPEQFQSHTMLAKREIISDLGKLSITVWAMKACPQKGILSLLMYTSKY